jgi:excisionase family DNA binding protein
MADHPPSPNSKLALTASWPNSETQDIGNASGTHPPAVPEAVRPRTIREVADHLGVSPRTIQRRLRGGFVGKVPLGGRLVRIPLSEVQRLSAVMDETGRLPRARDAGPGPDLAEERPAESDASSSNRKHP